MARRVRTLSVGLLTLFLAMSLFVGSSKAQTEITKRTGLPEEFQKSFGITPVREETEIGEVTEVSQDSLPSADSPVAKASEECHRQPVTMVYEDNKGPFIKFTGVKLWCYDGGEVTRAGMDVEAWIRPDARYEVGQDGYRYVPSGLKKTDRFLTYNGRRHGAHESVRIGRFEWRVHGFPRAAQVLNPYVSRTGRYNGACDGPKPRDVSPKVAAVRPAAGARGVSPSANVEAVFSRQMEASTLRDTTFFLQRKSSGLDVRGKIRYDARSRKAVLDPAQNLPAGTYTATVFAGPFGAMTTEDDPLVANKTGSFPAPR